MKWLEVLRGHYNRICDIIVDKTGPNDPWETQISNLNRSGTKRLNRKALTTRVAVEVDKYIQLALCDGIGTTAVAPIPRKVDERMRFFLDLFAVWRAIVRSSGKDVYLKAKSRWQGKLLG